MGLKEDDFISSCRHLRTDLVNGPLQYEMRRNRSMYMSRWVNLSCPVEHCCPFDVMDIVIDVHGIKRDAEREARGEEEQLPSIREMLQKWCPRSADADNEGTTE